MQGVEGVVFLNRSYESTQRGSLWTDITFPSLDSPTVSSQVLGFGMNTFGNLSSIQQDIRGLNLPLQSMAQDDTPLPHEGTSV